MSVTGQVKMMRYLGQDASVVKQVVKPGTAKRMLLFAVPYWRLLGLFLVMVVLDSSIVVSNPLIYRNIINQGMLKGNTGLIVQLALLACMLGLLDAALGLTQSYLAARLGVRIVLSLRTKLFEHILKMPLAFFSSTQTGALVGRLNGEVAGAQNAFTDILSNVVGNIVTVSIVLGAMFVLSWQIALLSLIVLPLFILPARYCGRRLQQITQEGYQVNAVMNNIMVERFNVSGALLLKLFGRHSDESKLFLEKAENVAGIDVRRTIYGRLLYAAMTLTAIFATALAYGIGGVLVVRRRLDVGTVVALVSYLARLYAPFAGLSNIQVSFMTALVSFQRIFEVLDLNSPLKESPSAVEIARGPARLAFHGVSFRYPSASEVTLESLQSHTAPDRTAQKLVLEEISFLAEPGQLIALVGPSGAGKTTITQLAARLYDVHSGSVTVNGIDIRDAKLESLRQRIGIVTQDAHLFHDTVRANLLYAKPDATEREISEALQAAEVLSLIQSLPNGLDTVVGQRGYRFSGGERQRIAIARLLLKAPDIVILDEATAHLDSKLEAAIGRTLDVMLTQRTRIVIAHRLSTIRNADQILVVKDGRIAERGTHPELFLLGGLYAELYQRQFAQTPSAEPHVPQPASLPVADLATPLASSLIGLQQRPRTAHCSE